MFFYIDIRVGAYDISYDMT